MHISIRLTKIRSEVRRAFPGQSTQNGVGNDRGVNIACAGMNGTGLKDMVESAEAEQT